MEIVVTDLTKFHNKDILCLAGVACNDNNCIRPMPYLKREYCLDNEILPGAKLAGEFNTSGTNYPHCEDRECRNILKSGSCSYDEFYSVLQKTLSPSLSSGFCADIGSGEKHFSCDCVPDKSIITIKVDPINFDVVDDQFNPGRIKGIFEDAAGNEFRYISITDFCFCEFSENHQTDYIATRKLNDFLTIQDEIYLRIGLTRRYRSQDGRDGYWVQINGIYPFPSMYGEIRNCFQS